MNRPPPHRPPAALGTRSATPRGTVTKRSASTRQEILHAGLRVFAERGYAGASIEAITAAARVAKPALYYYFGSKAGLFRALTDRAEDEIVSMLSNAAGRASLLPDRMVEVGVAVFQFARSHCDVIRLALGLLLLAKGAVPAQTLCPEKVRRRLGAIRKLMEQGLADGTFRRELDADQLTLGFVGMLQAHLMVHLTNPRHPLTRRSAEGVVHLFLEGAKAENASISESRPWAEAPADQTKQDHETHLAH